MAVHMIPEYPKDFDERSHEDVVFNALKNTYQGDEEYYVFHSYNVVSYNKRENIIDDRDLDFVIASQKKGILCVEVKAGEAIYYSGQDRNWHYSNGGVMHRGGPYKQVASAMRVLRKKVQYHNSSRVSDLYDKCRFLSAVCFVDMKHSTFKALDGLPENATQEITILQDDLEHIWDKIERIYAMRLPIEQHKESLSNGMSKKEFTLLLDSVLCPEFHLIPTAEEKNGLINIRLNQLISEQYRILDFLSEQPNAVINGAAGTGKTMLATEKARLHSLNDEKVLFLCYNKKLQKSLEDHYKTNHDFKNVDFRTISKLTKDKTGDFDNYAGLERWLDRCIKRDVELGYKHIIVDEGQDFGVIDVKSNPDKTDEGVQNCEIINKLQDAALEQGGTFYLFYDKYQTIQGGQEIENYLPDCIENADCRLTLHKNCRNTKEIAKTSATPIKDKKGKEIKVDTAFSWLEPYKPQMHIVDSKEKEIGILDRILEENRSLGIDDVVILSQGKLDGTSISNKLIPSTIDDLYDYYSYKGKKYRVATCITFKGLEADAIILLNLNNRSFSGERAKEFYVGTSRAKLKLDMICTFDDNDYLKVVSEIDEKALNGPKTVKAMKKIFGNLFSVEVIAD